MHQEPPSSSHSKQTPGQRRPNRHGGKALVKKTYASENDLPADLMFHHDYAATGPATPQKSNSASPAPGSMPLKTKSNKRNTSTNNAIKSRPKDISTSPGPPKPGRRTPPQSAGSKATGPAAFAGATFHASPAPSSLPMPSFIAKSFPDSPGRFQPRPVGNVGQEPSPPASDSDVPVVASGPNIHRDDSPLDIFFRADREEKERARRASSVHLSTPKQAPFSPPSQNRSPQEVHTFPRVQAEHPNRRPGLERQSSSGISSTEMDGTPGQSLGPAFSTPYQDRIKAARSGDKTTQTAPRILPRPQAPVSRSDALKKFLFANKPSPQGSAEDLGFAQISRDRYPKSQSSAGSPASPERTENRSANITAMEDSLRQILKLDSNMGLKQS